MDPVYIVFGFCVGVLVGLTGAGGGSLMTPLLITVVGVNPITAVGTDLAYAAVTKTVGGFKHFRQGTVDVRLTLWMACGSVPSAIGGVYVVKLLQRTYGHAFNDTLLVLIAAALLLTGAAMLLRAALPARLFGPERTTAILNTRHKVAAVAIGVFVGFVLGMTSAGSGALIVVALIGFRLIPTRIVGTGVFHAAILLWAASIAHVVAGDVDFGLAGTLIVGSVPGVWIGSLLAVRLPATVLRSAIAIVLLGSSLGLLSKAGVGVPTAVLAAVPALLAGLLGLQLVRRLRAPAATPAQTEQLRA